MRCGSHSGWAAHQRRGEKPCDACVRAKAEYDKRWRSATEQQRKARLASKAQRKALSRLTKLHPDEYRVLYVAAKAELEALAEGVTA